MVLALPWVRCEAGCKAWSARHDPIRRFPPIRATPNDRKTGRAVCILRRYLVDTVVEWGLPGVCASPETPSSRGRLRSRQLRLSLLGTPSASRTRNGSVRCRQARWQFSHLGATTARGLALLGEALVVNRALGLDESPRRCPLRYPQINLWHGEGQRVVQFE